MQRFPSLAKLHEVVERIPVEPTHTFPSFAASICADRHTGFDTKKPHEPTIGPSEATNRFNKAAIARLSNEPSSQYCTCPPDYPNHMGHHPDCVSQRVDEPSETCCTCPLTFCRGDPGDGCYCRIKPPVVETGGSQP